MWWCSAILWLATSTAAAQGRLGVDFDPGLLIVNGFSAEQALEVLTPHVLHVRAHDGVRDLAQGRGIEVPLGQGSVDFPAMLARLEQANYRGTITVERREAADPVTEIGNAVAYLRQLVN